MFARFRIKNEKEFNAVYLLVSSIIKTADSLRYEMTSEWFDKTEQFKNKRSFKNISACQLSEYMLELCDGNKDVFENYDFYLTFNNEL